MSEPAWTATTPATTSAYAEASNPQTLAEAIAKQLTQPTDYRPVPATGATRAATLLADLL